MWLQETKLNQIKPALCEQKKGSLGVIEQGILEKKEKNLPFDGSGTIIESLFIMNRTH